MSARFANCILAAERGSSAPRFVASSRRTILLRRCLIMAVATILPSARVRHAGRWNRISTNWARFLLPRRVPGDTPQAIPVPGCTRPIQIKIASTRTEWEEAFRLGADNYQARGFEAGDCDYRFTSYHALP